MVQQFARSELLIVSRLVGRIMGPLVAQTSESETQSRLDVLTRAVEGLEPGSPAADTDVGQSRT